MAKLNYYTFFLSNLHEKSIKLGLFDVFFIKQRNLAGKSVSLHEPEILILWLFRLENLSQLEYWWILCRSREQPLLEEERQQGCDKLGKENTRTQTQIAQLISHTYAQK